MKVASVAFLSVLTLIFTIGCAKHSQSLYQRWGSQLYEGGSTIRTVEDVSFLLGTPPNRCDPLEPTPIIGIRFRKDSATVTWVEPNSGAALAGMQAGEQILRINEVHVATGKDIVAVSLRSGEAVIIETTARTYTIKTKMPAEAKQCYWNIDAGAVAMTSGGAYVNKYGGSAEHSGAAYQSYFRSSCRFYDGIAFGCRSIWRE